MKNTATSKNSGVRAGRRPKTALYRDDALLMLGMSKKYEGVDHEVFGAFDKLRELLLSRIIKENIR